MTKKFIYLLSAITVTGMVPLFAQEGTIKAGEGTLTLDKKTYQLARALAYESMIDDEDAVVAVLSGQPVASETLKEAREAEKEGGEGDFKKPYLKLVFKKTGELKYWSAAAGGTQIGRHGGSNATAELKVMDGRATGKASQPVEADAMIPGSFDVKFNVALLKAGEELPASTPKKRGPAAKVKPTVNGIFKGNGKDAKLAYVSARWGEPFNDKPRIVLVFTEKDHSKDSKPDFNASFGKFGSAFSFWPARRGTRQRVGKLDGAFQAYDAAPNLPARRRGIVRRVFFLGGASGIWAERREISQAVAIFRRRA